MPPAFVVGQSDQWLAPSGSPGDRRKTLASVRGQLKSCGHYSESSRPGLTQDRTHQPPALSQPLQQPHGRHTSWLIPAPRACAGSGRHRSQASSAPFLKDLHLRSSFLENAEYKCSLQIKIQVRKLLHACLCAFYRYIQFLMEPGFR